MITTLTGSNHYLLDEELGKSLSNFKEKYGDFSIEQIDGTDAEYQTIVDSISNLPFLTPAKLVILKSPGTNKQFIEKIGSLLESIPSSNEIIIVEPNIDKRSKYYKLLKDNTDYKSFEELDVGSLVGWIVQAVKSKGGTISFREANYLVERVGVNQLRISNELDKLLNYQSEITKQTIDLLVEPIPQTTIFQLLDAAFSGRREEMIKIYEDQRRQKVEPQQIIAMLTWQLNGLALVKAAGDSPPAEISKKTKLSPFVVNKNLTISRKLRFEDIKRLLGDLLKLDIRLKSQSVDSDDALIQYLLSI